ncbi:MAG: DUF952 domain-containing protein [Synechococcus sp.]
MTLPVLYTFRRCPYAMRARWALLKAGLLVEWREVALRHKPAAMLASSPKGTVPVLITADGQVIDESLAVMDWALDQSDPCDLRGLLLTAQERETIQTLIQQNDGEFKCHLDRFKYTDRYPGAVRSEHQQKGLAILREWAQRLRSRGWLVSNRCTLADAALWPFVRQWWNADPEMVDRCCELAPLALWLERFVDSPEFDHLMARRDPWQQHDAPVLFPPQAHPVPLDAPLFHLALAADWHQALETGTYHVSTRGLCLAQVGFIHASRAEQLAATYSRFYSDADDVLQLTIDPAQIAVPLRADPVASGETFPHLFGPLPVQAVTDVRPYPPRLVSGAIQP